MEPVFSSGNKVRCKAGGPVMVVGHVHAAPVQIAGQHAVWIGDGLMGQPVPMAAPAQPQRSYNCYWWSPETASFQHMIFPEGALEDFDDDND